MKKSRLIIFFAIFHCSTYILAQPHSYKETYSGNDFIYDFSSKKNLIIQSNPLRFLYINSSNQLVSSNPNNPNDITYIFGNKSNLYDSKVNEITYAYFTKDNRYIVIYWYAGFGNSFCSIITPLGKEIRTIPFNARGDVGLTPDNKYIVTVKAQRNEPLEIKYFDLLTGTINSSIKLDTIKKFDGGTLSRDCKYFLSNGSDIQDKGMLSNYSIVYLYDITLKKKILEVNIPVVTGSLIYFYNYISPNNKAIVIHPKITTGNDVTGKEYFRTLIYNFDGTLSQFYDYAADFSNTGRYLTGGGITYDYSTESRILEYPVSGFSTDDKIIHIEQDVNKTGLSRNTDYLNHFIAKINYSSLLNDFLSKSPFFLPKDEFETDDEYNKRKKEGSSKYYTLVDSLVPIVLNKANENFKKRMSSVDTMDISYFEMSLAKYEPNTNQYEIQFGKWNGEKILPLGIYLKMPREDAKSLKTNFSKTKIIWKSFENQEPIDKLLLHNPFLSKDYVIINYNNPYNQVSK